MLKMINSVVQNARKINYKWHLLFGFFIRIIFVIYGAYHDENSVVQYTDVDYKVFTDGSRHILNRGSPYDRHTYRYSPLIAIILVPNILIHNCFGKVLFSIVDIIVAVLIRVIVKNCFREYESYKLKLEQRCLKAENQLKGIEPPVTNNVILPHEKPNIKRRHGKKIKTGKSEKFAFSKKPDKASRETESVGDLGLMCWLYNPLTIAIATRGNCDTIAGMLVLTTLYLLQCKKMCFVAGLVHGLSIHVRLYPIMYSLALFMYLSKFSYYSVDNRRKLSFRRHSVDNLDSKKTQNSEDKSLIKIEDKSLGTNRTHFSTQEQKTIFKREYLMYLIPNLDQLKLILGCVLSLTVLTLLFYCLYGYKFLYETYIFHLVRTDTRHNFSLFFYLQYLTAGVKNIGLWQKVLVALPQIVLLLVFSIRYGLNKFALNFSLLTQTIVMVTYNTVLTSQYFIWIWSILPLCIWQIKMSWKTSVFIIVIWFAAQLAWLLPAYFLEFQGQNTFLFIWVQSVSFFCANVATLGRLVMNFMLVKE